MPIKNNFILTGMMLLALLRVSVQAQDYDFQSVTNHYDQYSAKNISSAYNQSGISTAPGEVNSSYYQSQIQYPAQNIQTLSFPVAHDYRVGNVMPPAPANPPPKKTKPSAQEASLADFLSDTKPKPAVPLFLYLLILSSLALIATILIIIGVLKK